MDFPSNDEEVSDGLAPDDGEVDYETDDDTEAGV